VCNILVDELFPSKFRMENFTNRAIKRRTGSYRDENENLNINQTEYGIQKLRQQLKTKVCCYMPERKSENAY